MLDHRGLVAVLLGAALLQASCGASGASAPESGGATATPAPSVARAAVPDVEVVAFDGGSVSLADYAGTPLVVNFWASWCGPCIAEMPDLEAVHQLAGGRVTFVGVNTQDTPDQAADLVDATGVTYDLVRDPDATLFRAFGVFGMPSTFYVDADGTIVARHTGLLTHNALVEDLREHLGIHVQPAA